VILFAKEHWFGKWKKTSTKSGYGRIMGGPSGVITKPARDSELFLWLGITRTIIYRRVALGAVEYTKDHLPV
jgi:hypothetical protein